MKQTSKNLNLLLVYAFIIGCFLPINLLLAENLNNDPEQKLDQTIIPLPIEEVKNGETTTEIPANDQTSKQPANEKNNTDPNAQQAILNFLKNKLNFDLSLQKSLNEQEKDTKEKLVEMNGKITSLKGQLEYLENQTKYSLEKIKVVKKKRGELEVKIEEILEDIEAQKIMFEEEKTAFLEYLDLIYRQEQEYFENENLNTIKIFLTQDSISQVLQKKTYLSILKTTSHSILDNLEKIQNELTEKQNNLEMEQSKLIVLDKQLEAEQNNLSLQTSAKENLLRETKNKEDIFQKLLVQTIEQQEKVLLEINALRSNVSYLDKTTLNLQNILTPEQYATVLRIKTILTQKDKFKETQRFDLWPVSTENGFSAFFHDTNYISVFGVEHKALDIPIVQGTPIIAPLNGIVLKAVDNGLGYNYIALAHENGLITVYGHLSSLLVKEGDYIEKGQLFAASGGIPGTPGAGYRTTGAHLHLEVHSQGERVDPLLYFPIETLDPETIPDEYYPLLGIEKPTVTNQKQLTNTKN